MAGGNGLGALDDAVDRFLLRAHAREIESREVGAELTQVDMRVDETGDDGLAGEIDDTSTRTPIRLCTAGGANEDDAVAAQSYRFCVRAPTSDAVRRVGCWCTACRWLGPSQGVHAAVEKNQIGEVDARYGEPRLRDERQEEMTQDCEHDSRRQWWQATTVNHRLYRTPHSPTRDSYGAL